MERRYYGSRDDDGLPVVTVTTEEGETLALDPRRDIRDHSPTGFEWGYQGSGPAQLALALLADALGVDCEAERWYQEFKRQRIAILAQELPWSMSREEIWDWWMLGVCLPHQSDAVAQASEERGWAR